MVPGPDENLDHLDDDELEAIERELLEAAKAHKLPTSDSLPDEDVPSEALAQPGTELERRLKELEARAEGLLHSEIPEEEFDGDPHAREVDSKLGEFEARAAKARQTKETRLAKESKKNDQDRSAALGLGVGMSFIFSMIGLLLVGLGVGYLIDRSAGTVVWKGYGAVIGASLGMLFGLYQLNRFQNRL